MNEESDKNYKHAKNKKESEKNLLATITSNVINFKNQSQINHSKEEQKLISNDWSFD